METWVLMWQGGDCINGERMMKVKALAFMQMVNATTHLLLYVCIDSFLVFNLYFLDFAIFIIMVYAFLVWEFPSKYK